MQNLPLFFFRSHHDNSEKGERWKIQFQHELNVELWIMEKAKARKYSNGLFQAAATIIQKSCKLTSIDVRYWNRILFKGFIAFDTIFLGETWKKICWWWKLRTAYATSSPLSCHRPIFIKFEWLKSFAKKIWLDVQANINLRVFYVFAFLLPKSQKVKTGKNLFENLKLTNIPTKANSSKLINKKLYRKLKFLRRLSHFLLRKQNKFFSCCISRSKIGKLLLSISFEDFN